MSNHNLYAVINIAKNELGIDEDSYRMMISRINGGKGTSLKDCNREQLRAIVKELKAKGFEVKPAKDQPKRNKGSKRHHSAIHRKALYIWIMLHRAGVVRDGSDKAFNNFCIKHREPHSDWDHWHFMPATEASAIIEILKKWAGREEVKI